MREREIRSARILIVGGSATERDALGRTLGRAGFSGVEATPRGEEAVERYRRLLPDLVLLDLHEPAWEGLAVMAGIQENGDPPCPPILALSPEGKQSIRNAALRYGALDVMDRSADATELLFRVRHLLKRRALEMAQRDREEPDQDPAGA